MNYDSITRGIYRQSEFKHPARGLCNQLKPLGHPYSSVSKDEKNTHFDSGHLSEFVSDLMTLLNEGDNYQRRNFQNAINTKDAEYHEEFSQHQAILNNKPPRQDWVEAFQTMGYVDSEEAADKASLSSSSSGFLNLKNSFQSNSRSSPKFSRDILQNSKNILSNIYHCSALLDPQALLERPLANNRWVNLNITIPILIPHSTLVILPKQGSTYFFNDHSSAEATLFSQKNGLCNKSATDIKLRVAVIHKCPTGSVKTICKLFNEVLKKNIPVLESPIHINCKGILKHVIAPKTSKQQNIRYRYDTVAFLTKYEDLDSFRMIFDGLKDLAQIINQQGKENIEFRFSPCQQLRIPIREDCFPSSESIPSALNFLDTLETNNVKSSEAFTQHAPASYLTDSFCARNLVMGEMRLEVDKMMERMDDPIFLPDNRVMCKAIAVDSENRLGRVVFTNELKYPALYRPLVT